MYEMFGDRYDKVKGEGIKLDKDEEAYMTFVGVLEYAKVPVISQLIYF